jgi:pimeloyl-ACP methyl ester carboxylesterase
VSRSWFATAIGLAFVTLSLNACQAASGAGARPDPRAAQLVRLEDGRRINMRCAGHGSPTVLLEAGFGGYSQAWWRVQPEVAKLTRVCAYDRAGYGFSDPGPTPRDGAAIARDLDEALRSAGEKGPFIVVGHSAGALYARLFAVRRVKDVQGLVLLDPTVERIAAPGARDGLDGTRRRLLRCLEVSKIAPQPPPDDPRWDGCVPARADARVQALRFRPATWEIQLSELNEIFGHTSEEARRTRGLLNYVPVYVLTASETAAASPKVGYDRPKSVLELQHELLAGDFLRGWQRTILSSHLIMIDRPEVVTEAVEAMVQAARENRPPDGLPPSETGAAGEQAFPSDTP